MNYHTMEFIIRYVYKAYTLIILLIMKIAFIKKSCFVLWKYIIGRQNFLWKLKEVLYRVTCSVLKGGGVYLKVYNKSSRQNQVRKIKMSKNSIKNKGLYSKLWSADRNKQMITEYLNCEPSKGYKPPITLHIITHTSSFLIFNW